MEQNQEVLVIFKFLTWIAYSDLSRNLENWLILKLVFNHCKAVKVRPNAQIQMSKWFTSVFLMNGIELRSFCHCQILTWMAYSDLSRNLQIRLILKFLFILMEQNWEVLVIFKFRPKSHTRTIAEIFKLTNFDVCFHSL